MTRKRAPEKERSLKAGARRLTISNPEKVLFPDDRIAKGDLVDYYVAVSAAMLPHVEGRPVMMQRLPDGLRGEEFFQKETPDYFPKWVKRTTVKKERGTVTHPIIDNVATLAYLADQACITPHTWLSRADKIDRPDLVIFDLDPPERGRFKAVVEGARALRALLDELGLPSYVKTTGGHGLHVTVPLDRRADFDAVREFARAVAAVLASRDPQRFTTEGRKAKRRGRLYVDVMRNAYAQTAVPAYAVRAEPGAPVATPLDWDELTARADPRRFTLASVPKRLARIGDPWKGFWRGARSLTAARRTLDDLVEEEEVGARRRRAG